MSLAPVVFFSMGDCFAFSLVRALLTNSENSVNAKFAEEPFHALRWILVLLLGDASKEPQVRDVDAAPSQLQDPLVLQKPESTGYGYPFGSYDGPQLRVCVAVGDDVISVADHDPLLAYQPEEEACQAGTDIL